MHDPDRAKTQDRLSFTYTHNIPFENPNAAMRYMIDTAQDAENLKREAGVGNRGAKSSKRPVLTFSLSYDPQDNPTQQEMTNDAIDFMDKVLGLSDHQAIFYGHNDTAHPHIHVMANLVHPQTGRTHAPSWSKVKASDWAYEKAQERGIGHCPQREINKQKREQGKMVNYQDPHLQQQLTIQHLFMQSDSGKAFAAALEDHGFTLARGDRRGFVLVDENGKILSLSRQLDSSSRRKVAERFMDIEALRSAQEVAAEKMSYDREQATIDCQNKMLDAADTAAQTKTLSQDKHSKKKAKTPVTAKKEDKLTLPTQVNSQKNIERIRPYYEKIDRLQAWEQQTEALRRDLKAKLDSTHNRDKQLKRIKELESAKNKSNSFWGRAKGEYQKNAAALSKAQKTLAHSDWRTSEAKSNLEQVIQHSTPSDNPSQQRRVEQLKKEHSKLARAFFEGQQAPNLDSADKLGDRSAAMERIRNHRKHLRQQMEQTHRDNDLEIDNEHTL